MALALTSCRGTRTVCRVMSMDRAYQCRVPEFLVCKKPYPEDSVLQKNRALRTSADRGFRLLEIFDPPSQKDRVGRRLGYGHVNPRTGIRNKPTSLSSSPIMASVFGYWSPFRVSLVENSNTHPRMGSKFSSAGYKQKIRFIAYG